MGSANNAHAAPACRKHYTTAIAYALRNESNILQL